MSCMEAVPVNVCNDGNWLELLDVLLYAGILHEMDVFMCCTVYKSCFGDATSHFTADHANLGLHICVIVYCST